MRIRIRWTVGVATLKRGPWGECQHRGSGLHVWRRWSSAKKPLPVSALCTCYDKWWASRVVGPIAIQLKRSHYSPFCRRKHEKLATGSEKAAVTSKWRHNSWTKRFQWKPHDKNLQNTMQNPRIPCVRHKNEVGSRFRGNRLTDRHTHTHTHTQNDYRNLTAHARRRLMISSLLRS